METPSSFARITRSQVKAASINNTIPISRKKEESSDNKVDVFSKQRNVKMDRSALFDITNDSPIIGLALRTPSSLFNIQDHHPKQTQTPGSGEALLRGQVKILLQKVDEKDGLASEHSQEVMLMPEEVSSWKQPSIESEKSDVTRALMFDFFDKPEELSELLSSPCSSVLTQVTSVCKNKSKEEDDDASVWSILVNTSRLDEDEEYQDEDVEEEEEGGFVIDQLCQGMSKIFVQNKKAPADFQGKHTRFVYNSDEEIEKVEVVNHRPSSSSSILNLKGIPTPQGKHLRFQEEEEESED